MFDFDTIKLILVLIFFMVFTTFYTISFFNSIKYKVPQVSTFKSDFKILEEGLKKYNLEGKKIIDLGSGIGKAIRFFEKKFKMKATGYEIDISNILIAKVLNKIFSSKTKLINKNYFKADLSEFDYIYVYLFPELMEKVEEKIFKNAKKDTIIFVNAFKFQKHKPIDIFYKNGKEKILVYKV